MTKAEALLTASKLQMLAFNLRLDCSLLMVETLIDNSPENRREWELKIQELNMVLEEWKSVLAEMEK